MQRWLVTALLLLSASLQADIALPPPAIPTSVISIIIDDLGHRYRSSHRAVHLPWPVTCSFLPHTPHSVSLAKQAWLLNKEVMVHLPMEAVSGKNIGPGGLTMGMERQDFDQVLNKSLSAIPHASGTNNHMGSLLTRNITAMNWLMSRLANRENFYFVDSRTTRESQAMALARQHGILNTGRDIFLDHDPDKQAVQRQFTKLLRYAERYGSALAIGHPRPATLEVLEQSLPLLAEKGIRLVPVSELIRFRSQRKLAWQTSSSPLPRAAKKLKQ